MIKQLELWSLRVPMKNYDPFPNLDNFLESTVEELSVEDARYFKEHGMQDMQRIFRNYVLPIPDKSKNWFRYPFENYIHQINGLASCGYR